MEQYDEQQAADGAWAFLRCNSTASLSFGENNFELSYIVIPDGRLVISAMVAMLQPCDIVMYVPGYEEGSMEMHVSLEQFSESGENGIFADRWQVYHGEPPDTQWAFVDIDAARFHELFIDGDSLRRENPFAMDEHFLCKTLNEKQDVVRKVCAAKTNVEVTNPFVVGVDPLGVDIRAPFGIVRIQSDATLHRQTMCLRSFNSHNPLLRPNFLLGDCLEAEHFFAIHDVATCRFCTQQ